MVPSKCLTTILLALATLSEASLRGGSAVNTSVQQDDTERPHAGNRHLFEFSGSCTDADYATQPLYVSSIIGNNWNMDNGWGLSTEKPFRTIQHAVDNRAECQTIYVMIGIYRNNYYGQSLNHNNKLVNLNGVSDLKILAHPDAVDMPLLEFDGPGKLYC